jgi:hypothetical protein
MVEAFRKWCMAEAKITEKQAHLAVNAPAPAE